MDLLIQRIHRLDRRLVALMATAAGLAVANLYYAQPMLPQIAESWELTSGKASAFITIAQAGYAIGLILVVPLGDTTERRTLIITMLLLSAVALILAGSAASPLWLGVASFAIGITTVTPQILLPLAADMAGDGERGKVMGTVMSGLLIGILLARTISGTIGGWLGWRAMYFVAAGIMLILAASLRVALPKREPLHAELGYFSLLRSIGKLALEERQLRVSSLLGALSFASFSAFWTVLPFLLVGPPYLLGSAAIGLFGLIGVIGITVAPLVGRMADAGRGREVAGFGLIAILVAYWVFAFAAGTFGLLIAGLILLDMGITANHLVNQSFVYGIRPDARSRINTVYMATYFLGGALGSFAGAQGWSQGGWIGFCAAGASFVVLALLLFAFGKALR